MVIEIRPITKKGYTVDIPPVMPELVVRLCDRTSLSARDTGGK